MLWSTFFSLYTILFLYFCSLYHFRTKYMWNSLDLTWNIYDCSSCFYNSSGSPCQLFTSHLFRGIYTSRRITKGIHTTCHRAQVLREPWAIRQTRYRATVRLHKSFTVMHSSRTHPPRRLLSSLRWSDHEKAVGELARRLGFSQVSLSSEVMPMVRAVPRGYTVCADAYLTPKIRQYLQGFTSGFKDGLKVWW